MSKCICKQIAEMSAKNDCKKVHVCTGHACICGHVDVEKTNELDGILVIKNAKVKCKCCDDGIKEIDCIGIGGRHIMTFFCGELNF